MCIGCAVGFDGRDSTSLTMLVVLREFRVVLVDCCSCRGVRVIGMSNGVPSKSLVFDVFAAVSS